ncbi:hypothetical protein SAMN05421770_106201 [Granulicella rosea]|uniref:Uncharacterized protein n=1 Tax=Granulicella rosea TaxID=474952 RepID=A0A239L9K0_9BACT|nr:hypothetical protein [Granulicella rosea]SNT26960.1 hypothetical protein SAMN05421770_106201 [Granulicella rosea]
MSSFDSTRPEPNNPEERVAFCQHCGKPLTAETIRRVGPAVYCEPCLEARLGGTPGSNPAGAPGYTPVDPGPASGWTAPVSTGVPNPGLAALLGFIPGVGAMYNEQYAKGLVHLLVFATLVMLSNANGIFGLFVAGWVFYMVIEAHHTARARRDGMPLPNPFGLNDIGERMGFGRSWPMYPPTPNPYTPPTDPATAGAYTAPPVPPVEPGPWNTQTGQQTYREASWGAPADTYAHVPPIPPVPPMPPYGAAYAAVDPGIPPYAPPYVPPRNRFPGGAIWLIGLGVLFLIGDTGLFNFISGTVCIGILLVGLGGWIFYNKLTETGHGLADDGTPFYRLRLYRALRSSIWLSAIGLMLMLNGFRILRWEHSWPWFLILAGALALLERMTYNNIATAPTMPPVPEPASSAAPTTQSIVPFTRRDEEGR